MENLVQAITFHTGQVCCDATRWLVQRADLRPVRGGRQPPLAEVKIGYHMDPATQMGPVVNEKQQRPRPGLPQPRPAKRAPTVVLEGGKAEVPGYDGFYVKPALLAGPLDNIAAREEIFGPIAYLAPFDDEQQAVRMANQTDYGLANSVWTSDLARAARVAEAMLAGNSWINAHNIFPHGVPYAGINKQRPGRRRALGRDAAGLLAERVGRPAAVRAC